MAKRKVVRMGRPSLSPNGGDTKPTLVRFSPDVKRELATRASAKGISLAGLVRELVESSLMERAS